MGVVSFSTVDIMVASLFIKFFAVFGLMCCVNGASIVKAEGQDHQDLRNRSSAVDPTLLAGLFEGDIVLPRTRAATRIFSKWSNGYVPYNFSPDFNQKEQDIIRGAMQIIEDKTCLRFGFRGRQKNYIHFVKGDEEVGGGCWSYIGNIERGLQKVSIDNGCFSTGTIIHELLHAVGFRHEQSRTDRDQYVKINHENIRKGKGDNFKKYAHDEIDLLGIEYDYCSIMHYSAKAFSKNTKPTIEALRETECDLGHKDSLSESDILKINKFYQCDDY